VSGNKPPGPTPPAISRWLLRVSKPCAAAPRASGISVVVRCVYELPSHS